MNPYPQPPSATTIAGAVLAAAPTWATNAWVLDVVNNAWQAIDVATLHGVVATSPVGQPVVIADGNGAARVYVTETGGVLLLAPEPVQHSVLAHYSVPMAPSQQPYPSLAYVQQMPSPYQPVPALYRPPSLPVPMVTECHMRLSAAPDDWYCQQLPSDQCCYALCRANAPDGICRGFFTQSVPVSTSVCPAFAPPAPSSAWC